MENKTARPVKIITVSTSDLPDDLAVSCHISVIPEYVRFGENLYRDRVEMSVEHFLHEIETNPNFPKTTPPTPADYQQAFAQALEEGYDVLYLGLSNKISSGLKMAQLARNELSQDRIELVDSQSLSMGLGLVAQVLAERAKEGLPLSALVKMANELIQRTHALFIVPNLDFLKRGGRLSGTQALLGGLLQVKPLLQVTEGEIKVREKVRGNKERAIKHMIEVSMETYTKGAHWAVAHIGCQDDAEKTRAQIIEATGDAVILAPCGVVVGTHCGPGGLGVFRLNL